MRRTRQDLASFRDPSGYLFWIDDTLYRQVNISYQEDYDSLIGSGLYQSLVDDDLMIPHQEVKIKPNDPNISYLVIRPERVPFISYPYEWCFSQLKDAALLTLEIQKRALDKGLSLKDSSAYNIQYRNGRPIFIDTLSFEKYKEGQPWTAYRQFCQHFLAPLALISYRDVQLSQLLRVFIDGIPLDLASKLLPSRTRLNIPILMHIHLHAAAQQRYAGQKIDISSSRQDVRKSGLLGIISSLESIIRKLKWNPERTVWADYSTTHNYDKTAVDHKIKLINEFLDKVQPGIVWDLGANIGFFSRLASRRKIPTLAFDIDPGAVELNYRQCIEEQDHYLFPLLLDLTNPSPSIGWANQERSSLVDRCSADMVMALALIHHLAITNNVPLTLIARFMAELGPWLMIEFVPKEDPQTQRLLASRVDIFKDYSQIDFEKAFRNYYEMIDSQRINHSHRTIYLLKRR